jgi:hypothetical protein
MTQRRQLIDRFESRSAKCLVQLTVNDGAQAASAAHSSGNLSMSKRLRLPCRRVPHDFPCHGEAVMIGATGWCDTSHWGQT